MCLPRAYQQAASGDQSTDDQNLGQGLADLDNTREEVLKEVTYLFIYLLTFLSTNFISLGFKYTTSS